MRFGVNTLIWTAGFNQSNLDLLPRIKEYGFDGVEIARFDWTGFPAAEIRRAAASHGLECIACSALVGNMSLITEDAAVRRSSLEFMEQAIRSAAEMGSSLLVGPYCSAVGYLAGRRRTKDEWKRAVEGLQSLGTVLDEHGVTLALEPLNRFETYFLNTVSDAVRLCGEINHPRIGVLFDTFHANIEEKDVGVACRTLGPHLKHVHCCENDRGTPGTGHAGWSGLFPALQALNYNGWLVIESFGFAIKEIASAACIWRDLAGSPDEIAREGVKFLRASIAP